MITIKHKGNFSKTYAFLRNAKKNSKYKYLDKYGHLGVEALASATPTDTGRTANSWYYKIIEADDHTAIQFLNSNIQDNVPIAIILQYGHATRNGGWVEGRDYINPAIQPVFDKLLKDAWREVVK